MLVAGFMLLGFKQREKPTGAGGGSGVQFYYTTATSTNFTIGTSWTANASPLLPADSSRGYIDFCNNSIVANDAIYLGLGATSSSVSGIRIPTGSCYEMTQANMFYGNIYAMASTSTSTLLTVIGKY